MWIGIFLAAIALSAAATTIMPPSRLPAVNDINLTIPAKVERGGAGVRLGEKVAVAAIRQHRAAVELISTRLPLRWYNNDRDYLTLEDVPVYVAGAETVSVQTTVRCISSGYCANPGSVWLVSTYVEKGTGDSGGLVGGKDLTVQTRSALASMVGNLRREMPQFPGAAGVLIGHVDYQQISPSSSTRGTVARWTSADASLAVPAVAALGGPQPRENYWSIQGTVLATPIVKQNKTWDGF